MPPKIPRRLPFIPKPKFEASPSPRRVPAAPKVAPKSQPRSSPTPARPWLLRFFRVPTYPRLIVSLSGTTFISFCGFLLIRDNFVSFDKVIGQSMAPTLSPLSHETGQEEHVLIQMGVMARKNVQRGDIVTFWKPHKPTEVGIKRVVAVGGDIVYPRRGFAVDEGSMAGERLELMDGLVTREEQEMGVQGGKVTVPHGHIWVEGDNWRKSFDSCDFGPISLGLVDGRAKRVWRKWWWRGIEDGRSEKERRGASRVVEGKESEVPREFLA